ncbi:MULTISPECIES: hypothetical protein [Microbacterium]|nr:hypothetical protein [Microbacterium phyllosphaerae]MCS3443084.1 hypothetical protein [Microbacterium phyllosphaerae]
MTDRGERIISIDITHLVRAALGQPADPRAQVDRLDPETGTTIPSTG